MPRARTGRPRKTPPGLCRRKRLKRTGDNFGPTWPEVVTDIQELTPTILNELVEKIVVYQAEGTGKGRTQRLEIHYIFVGIIDTPEVACRPLSVMIDTRQGVAVEYITR